MEAVATGVDAGTSAQLINSMVPTTDSGRMAFLRAAFNLRS
jgi:hypothetical protein